AVLVSPAGPDRANEGAAVAGRSARIRGDGSESFRREYLPFEIEACRVLTDGSAVTPQDGRKPSGGNVGRARQIRVDHRAVGALRLVTLDGSQRDLREEVVVDVREARRLWRGAFSPAIAGLKGPRHKEDFTRPLRLAVEIHDVAALRHVVGRQIALAVQQTIDGTAAGGDAREVHVPSLLEEEQHLRSIRGELRRPDVAVDVRRQNPR